MLNQRISGMRRGQLGQGIVREVEIVEREDDGGQGVGWGAESEGEIIHLLMSNQSTKITSRNEKNI